jgi:hypothetical protein
MGNLQRSTCGLRSVNMLYDFGLAGADQFQANTQQSSEVQLQVVDSLYVATSGFQLVGGKQQAEKRSHY